MDDNGDSCVNFGAKTRITTLESFQRITEMVPSPAVFQQIYYLLELPIKEIVDLMRSDSFRRFQETPGFAALIPHLQARSSRSSVLAGSGLHQPLSPQLVSRISMSARHSLLRRKSGAGQEAARVSSNGVELSTVDLVRGVSRLASQLDEMEQEHNEHSVLRPEVSASVTIAAGGGGSVGSMKKLPLHFFGDGEKEPPA